MISRSNSGEQSCDYRVAVDTLAPKVVLMVADLMRLELVTIPTNISHHQP